MGDGADDAYENALRDAEREGWHGLFEPLGYWPSSLGMPLYAFEGDVPLYELLLGRPWDDYSGDYDFEDPRPGDST